MNDSAIHQSQSIERDALKSHHLTPARMPAGLVAVTLQQHRVDLENPCRIDGAHGACINPVGLHDLTSDNPLGRLARLPRSGPETQGTITRSEIVSAIIMARNISEQSAQHSDVNCLIILYFGKSSMRFDA